MRAAVIVFAVCAALCAIAHVAILRSVVRAASQRSPAEPGIPQPRFGLELLWAIVPMIALALVLTATWARVRVETPEPAQPVLEIAR
jgi:hypothetical protein